MRLNHDELQRSPLAICIAPVLSWRDADAEPAGGHAPPPTPLSFIWTMFDEVAWKHWTRPSESRSGSTRTAWEKVLPDGSVFTIWNWSAVPALIAPISDGERGAVGEPPLDVLEVWPAGRW